MPRYDYKCGDCHEKKEVLMEMMDAEENVFLYCRSDECQRRTMHKRVWTPVGLRADGAYSFNDK